MHFKLFFSNDNLSRDNFNSQLQTYDLDLSKELYKHRPS